MTSAYLPSPLPPPTPKAVSPWKLWGAWTPLLGWELQDWLPHYCSWQEASGWLVSQMLRVVRSECHRGHFRGRWPAQHCHQLLSRRCQWCSRGQQLPSVVFCLCCIPSLNTPGTQQSGHRPFVFLWGGQRWYRMGYLSAHHWSLPGPSFAFLRHMQLLERQGMVYMRRRVGLGCCE